MKPRLLAATMLLALAALAQSASAHIDEYRAGVVYNLRSDHGDIVDGKDDGVNVEGEVVWSSPQLLHWLGSPRPYVVASINTEGDTSFAGLGALWRWNFAEHWAFEPGFGYILHNGEIDNKYADGTPAAANFEEHHQLLGSRDLFRTTFALEREFGAHSAAQLYYEHMSHGQILDKGRNQGLDLVGIRWVYRINPDAAD